MAHFGSISRIVRVMYAGAAFMLLTGMPSQAGPAGARWNDGRLRAAIRSDLNVYLQSRHRIEHISCSSVSVSFPDSPVNLDVVVGTTEYGGGFGITPRSQFQIGSNTKSFTSATLLELEAEGRVSIQDTVGKWLPQYQRYANIKIWQLLDMTSGIQTYDSTDAWMKAYSAEPTARARPEELIAYVNGSPLETGWLYSNTNYLLAQLIVEKVTQHSYADEIYRRFFRPLRLDETFYNGDITPTWITSRMPAGYFFSHDADNAGLRSLLGADMRPLSLSWAQAAGAIISTPTDLTHWIRALLAGTLLPPKQHKELMTLVANDDGRPVAEASPKHPKAFGLAVGQLYNAGIGGVIWYYEGETLGYRMLYAWFPRSGVIIAVALNSQPNSADDAIGPLLESVYKTLQAAHRV